MAKFRFTNKALDDLIEIWDYTVEIWSENQAEKYYDLIMASCMDLANNPQLGKPYDILAINVVNILYSIRKFYKMKLKLLEFYTE